jgi:hypothetical protein
VSPRRHYRMTDNILGIGRSELKVRWQLHCSTKFTKLQLLRNSAVARAGCPMRKSTAYRSLLFVTNAGLFVVGAKDAYPAPHLSPSCDGLPSRCWEPVFCS